MNRISKKLLSCVLALLIAITSAPFTAFADDASLVSLKQAISEYESKMDGTVYTDMQPAYGAYVAARESAYAYEYGDSTGLDLQAVADTLASLTAAMKPWTSYKGTATTSFGDDSTPDNDPIYEGAYDGYIVNLLYSSGVGKYGDKTTIAAVESSDGKVITELYYPTTVMLYDGETQPVVPVMAMAKLNVNENYSVYSLYISENLSENKKSSLFDLKDKLWPGANGNVKNRNLNWPWTMKQTDGYPATYPNNSDTKLDLSHIYYAYYRAAMANAITYTGGDAGFAANEYYTVNNLNWRRFTGVNAPSDFLGMYAGAIPIYVVNYKALKTAVSSKSALISSNLLSTLKNKNSFSTLLGAIDSATDFDPNESFNNDNKASDNVAICANTIKQKVEAINNAACQLNAMSDYDALSSAIETTKSVYEKNNSDGKYTAESFGAFKQDYETAVADAAAVASRGFTSTTSGTKLLNSYKALNIVTPSSGTSGDTSFTFNSETGVAVINGMGNMADYESGAQSPFGDNSSVTTVGINENIEYIGANAFKGARNLKTITVPAEATYGEGAFDDCTSLATVIITGGDVKKLSAENAPWQRPSVKVVELGENESDFSVASIGDDVFTDCRNAVFYIYNTGCNIPSESAVIFGVNPTFYGWTPSTAKTYADKFGYKFVSLGHEHTWDGGTVVEPTCKNSGYTIYNCIYCDKTESRNHINALGHDYVEEVIPPTCTEREITVKTCSRCQNVIRLENGNANGHTYDSSATPQYAIGAPMIAENVYKHKVSCSVCNKSSVSEYCSVKIDSYEDNNIIFKCSVCGGTYLYNNDISGKHTIFYFDENKQLKSTEKVDDGGTPQNVPDLPNKEGHSFAWTLDDDEINPADTIITNDTVFYILDKLEMLDVTYYDIDGNETVKKVAYGSTPSDIPTLSDKTRNEADNGHSVVKWDIDPATAIITSDTIFREVYVLVEHNFTDTVFIPVTCTTNGEMSRFCEECGYHIENEVIYAKGHTPETDKAVSATCTTAGKTAGSHCSVCKTVFEAQKTIAASKHKWNSGVVTKAATVDNTGVKTYTCNVCKATRTEAIPKLPGKAASKNTIKDITPSDAVANKAPVNKSIKKPSGITTVSQAKKKQLIISFKPVTGAQNYRVMYRKAGAKKWNYAWTDGKTSYTLKKLKNKGLYEFAFAAYKLNSKGEWERGSYSKTSYRYYYKEKIKKAKAKKKAIAVSWEKDKSATGYELYYSTNSNMKGAKKVDIKNKKKTSYTIKKLKTKKKYYVRVRAIKKYKGKSYIGEYSAKKKVKVK